MACVDFTDGGVNDGGTSSGRGNRVHPAPAGPTSDRCSRRLLHKVLRGATALPRQGARATSRSRCPVVSSGCCIGTLVGCRTVRVSLRGRSPSQARTLGRFGTSSSANKKMERAAKFAQRHGSPTSRDPRSGEAHRRAARRARPQQALRDQPPPDTAIQFWDAFIAVALAALRRTWRPSNRPWSGSRRRSRRSRLSRTVFIPISLGCVPSTLVCTLFDTATVLCMFVVGRFENSLPVSGTW